MRSRFIVILACGLFAAWGHAAEPVDPSLLLWLPFDEGRGTFAADRSDNLLEANLSQLRWATGAFGTAIHFGGTNAFAELPPVPGLNGATQFTLSVWATWEDPAPRRYPNLLTSHNWSPGGMMLFVTDTSCSFRLGRPGVRAGGAGSQWVEASAPLLRSLPQQTWTHLCVTFALPNLVTYVNGKQIGRATWPYPVGTEGLRLGGWSGAVSHHGLLDDLRIYGRALSSEEVAALASPKDRVSAAYMLADEAASDELIVVRFRTRYAELAIDASGQVVSLRNRKSGRELLARPVPLVRATLADGRSLTARRVTVQDNRLTFSFPRGQGTAELDVDASRDFMTFTVRALTLSNVTALTFCELPAVPTVYRGSMANMLSDDTDAVCLRGYELPVETEIRGDTLKVSTTAEHGLTGWRAGLAVGPKDRMPAMLREMTLFADVPFSRNCGPWALEAEAARGSYLFADLAYAATDDWIEIARRGGFSTIHLHGWWQTLGHYAVRTNYYPRGLPDMQDAVARIHDAGMRAGIHTLTACISTRDPWITPEASPHLIPFNSYTLARSLSPTDTVVYVNEPPSVRHDTVFTYSGRGNAIRIGSEIIQYAEISHEPPYAFKACKRGAFKTHPAAHAAGAQADYLQQRYLAFYPQPDSPLADELSACIAHVFNTCELDQLYFDGSEGMMSRYGIDAMRHNIMRRLNGDPVIEASCYGAHNWWFHSRLGTWDHPVWAPKLFHDDHVKVCERYRKTDLLGPQMGWWAPRMAVPFARGHHLDEMEYFACKNLSLDAAMSIQGVNVNNAPLPVHLERQFTLLGWYEHLRLARYFDDVTVARLVGAGSEFRLRQNADGEWRFTPVTMHTQRITGPDDGSADWRVVNPAAQQPLCVRVEALYTAAPTNAPGVKSLVSAEEFAAFKTATASSAVRLGVSEVTADTRGGPRNLRLRAENRGATATGAWARATLDFSAPYRHIGGTGAFGLWVKGDGSGALLNLQLRCPREFMGAMSDHYVTLDFTGWRYVTLLARERDTARIDEFVWPYRHTGAHSLFRTPLDMAHIAQVSLYLNAVPPGGGVDVTVSPVQALPVKPVKLERPVLTVNGQRLIVPFTLASGEFAELEPDGIFTHYSERGDPLARVESSAADAWPDMLPGANALTCADGRAEVSVTTFGEPFGTRRSRFAVDWTQLTREYEMPHVALASNDVGRTSWDVMVRPGERAALEIELCDAMSEPKLNIGEQTVHFPVTLKAGERLICRDRRSWRVLNAKREVLSEGQLAQDVPLLRAGATRIEFTSAGHDRVLIKLVKAYKPRSIWPW